MIPSEYKLKILFAEDDYLFRTVAEDVMREAGYEVVSVSDGEGAKKELGLIRPDLILCDIRMPRGTGFDFLRYVRSKATCSFTPFIFISAHISPEDMRSIVSLGADGYLTKPFSPEDLLRTIELRLARSRLLAHGYLRKQQFLSHDLPHEMRSALCGVMGYAELILDSARSGKAISSAEAFEVGTNIRRSGQLLLNIAENLALRSWLTREVKSVTEEGGEDFSVGSFSTTLLEGWLESLLEARGRRGDVSLEVQPGVVRVPAQGLSGVIVALVNSVLKSSPIGTPVILKGSPNGSYYELLVFGRGRSVVVQEFSRVAESQDSGRGVALQQELEFGLDLVRDFAQLAGGSFYLTKSSSGQSTAGCLRLPLVIDPS